MATNDFYYIYTNDHLFKPTYLDLCFRKLRSFILIPVVQCQLDDFKQIVWNSHRIRHQKDTLLPDGVPDHIYNFPQEYGLEECGK